MRRRVALEDVIANNFVRVAATPAPTLSNASLKHLANNICAQFLKSGFLQYRIGFPYC
jgi:hypothetical protein